MPKSRRRKKKAASTGRYVKITPRMQEIIENQLERFREKFGRDPGQNEPIFFDPDAAEPVPIGDLQSKVLEAMSKANLPPEFAYAYRKTGLLGLGRDKSAWDPADIAEWNAAVDEYRAIERAKQRPDFPAPDTWNTEIPELLLSPISRDDLSRLEACLKALSAVEPGINLVTHIELAATIFAAALDHGYRAGEEMGDGEGVEAFETTVDLVVRRAREIYGQRSN